jgi:HEAT repeat protein
MSTKDIKKLLENGQTNQIAERFRTDALSALGEILTKEKSVDIQNNALITYRLVSELAGPLSRKEIKPFIDSLGTGKINPNCRDEIVQTMNQLGDLAIAQLLDYSLKSSENLKLFFYDILGDIDEKTIIETLLAEKITSPGMALAYEIMVKTNDSRFLTSEITVYDSSLDYTFDLPSIKEAILSGLNLSDLESNIRAVRICSKYKSISTEVVPNLVNILDSSQDSNLIVETLKTLGAIGSENAVNAINKKISIDNPKNIRIAAIGALGEVKTDSSKAISILIQESLYDKDDDVRFKTINALGKIGEPAAPVLVDLLQKEENLNQIEIALKRVGESAVPHLLEALTNKKTRKNAIDLAKLILTPKYGFQGTVSKLIEFLGDKNPEIQEEVINTIIEMGDPGLESVIRALNSQHPKVRENASEILGRFGTMNIHLYIENMVKDPKKLVQTAELLTLLAIYQPDDDIKAFSFEQFDILLVNQDYNEHIQQAVFDNILGNVSTDSDPDTRFAFGQVAYYLGYPALPHLLQMLNDKDEDVVEVALDSIGLLKKPEETISEIANKLKSKSSKVRLAAVNALGNLESNESISFLIEALGDQDVEIQDAASSAIDQIGDVGLPALIETMDHKEPRMRDRVARLIASHGDRAWEPLLERLNTNNSNFQETAIEVIGLLGDHFAERLLTFVQTTLDENTQFVSIQGLGKLLSQPALSFIANAIQTSNKKIIQAVSSAHNYYKEDLTNVVLQDLEKSSGNAEKVVIDYLQKESDPRWTIIPVIQQLSKKTSKAVVYIDLLKKFGDKKITESFMELLQNNQLETVDELFNILQQFQDLNKLTEKVSVNIPR